MALWRLLETAGDESETVTKAVTRDSEVGQQTVELWGGVGGGGRDRSKEDHLFSTTLMIC